jgi:pimeloyl-ACP methyl ester carboxylesterase
MKHQLDGVDIHIATGGRPFDANGEVVIMLHGSGQNHLTWVLQSRYFAYRGFSVLAPDLPGHGMSTGAPPATIEDMAAWVIRLMDSLQVSVATLVGHSQGCLIAIEAAAAKPATDQARGFDRRGDGDSGQPAAFRYVRQRPCQGDWCDDQLGAWADGAYA